MNASPSSHPIEHGDPALDPGAFRRSLGQFATGVSIMATDAGGRPVGVTASSFSSLSLDPPLILWSISRTSRSFGPFSSARHFAVSVLAETQVDVSKRLSSASADKFEGVSWHRGLGGSPLIDGAVATFECSMEAVHDGGDHVLLIGRVLRHARYPGKALLYLQGRYAVADEHRMPAQFERIAPVPSAEDAA